MAVKSEIKENKLILTLDNGEKKVFEEVRKKWNFKDEQSLIRFALSILDCSTKTFLTIYTEKGVENIIPADDLINGK
jgi:hypothetical protein